MVQRKKKNHPDPIYLYLISNGRLIMYVMTILSYCTKLKIRASLSSPPTPGVTRVPILGKKTRTAG